MDRLLTPLLPILLAKGLGGNIGVYFSRLYSLCSVLFISQFSVLGELFLTPILAGVPGCWKP